MKILYEIVKYQYLRCETHTNLELEYQSDAIFYYRKCNQ